MNVLSGREKVTGGRGKGAAGSSTGAAADPLEVEEAAPDEALAPMHGVESTVGDPIGTVRYDAGHPLNL
jgi:hypothetical protein